MNLLKSSCILAECCAIAHFPGESPREFGNYSMNCRLLKLYRLSFIHSNIYSASFSRYMFVLHCNPKLPISCRVLLVLITYLLNIVSPVFTTSDMGLIDFFKIVPVIFLSIQLPSPFGPRQPRFCSSLGYRILSDPSHPSPTTEQCSPPFFESNLNLHYRKREKKTLRSDKLSPFSACFMIC